MLQIKKTVFMLALTLLEASCSNLCPKASYNFCSTYPVGGKKVEEELQRIPYDGYENFWEWLGRINKLRLELEMCQ